MSLTVTISQFSGGQNQVINQQLDFAANYLYSLCGIYAFKAQGISGGGGSISPITPVPSYQYAVLQASVANGDMVAGQSTLQSPDLIGALNVDYFVMNNTNYTIGVDFSFNNVSGTISLLNGDTWGSTDLLVLPFSKKIN